MDQEQIGAKIKALRLKHGYTQQQFANIVGVTYQAVSKWETGKSVPDIGTLHAICARFQVDLSE